MADPELEAIRQQRLAQLQSQFKSGNVDNKQAMEEKRQQIEDRRNAILIQVLDQSARARLNTLCLGKPEKGKMVEDMILNMAQRGQLSGKLGEKGLISLLESVNQQTQRKTVVKFDRRRAALDSDDDDL
ncbi:Programmed cell death protein 5 [Habropoda laboriosa]|uniref:Programmed cell death protein 5 n=1 Tax=Habropoda laboriosa TaxID=597456 RepID=A0A0L7QZH3_9HYME|nr:PREDICTED: programmed cell death protein 5 [Habropoda laboriosa]KOC63942.1 Programmed cell death protein 5 [Habropoda laboriosa]